MANVEDIEKGEVSYILLDESIGELLGAFEAEDEIEDFLREEDYCDDDLESIRVFEVTQEYKIKKNSSYELEEV